MEISELKSTWNAVQTPKISETEIQSMLSENNHPVLKDIWKQVKIETVGWCIFLFCYYSMFDGNKKPLWLNIMLVFSVLFPIVHGLVGYHFAKYIVRANDIRGSLKSYLSKVKIYAVISVISRQIYLANLLLFFTYGLNFDTKKYVLLGVIALIFILQLIISSRIWAKRVKRLKEALISFN